MSPASTTGYPAPRSARQVGPRSPPVTRPQLRRDTGADNIMIGRGALCNASIFRPGPAAAPCEVAARFVGLGAPTLYDNDLEDTQFVLSWMMRDVPVKGAALLRQRVVRAKSHEDIARVATTWEKRHAQLLERQQRRGLGTLAALSSGDTTLSKTGIDTYTYRCPILVRASGAKLWFQRHKRRPKAVCTACCLPSYWSYFDIADGRRFSAATAARRAPLDMGGPRTAPRY